MVANSTYYKLDQSDLETLRIKQLHHNIRRVGLQKLLQRLFIHVHTVCEVFEGAKGVPGVAFGENAQRTYLANAAQRQNLKKVGTG